MNERTLISKVTDSPVGPLTLIADETALVAVLWPDDAPGRVRLEHRPARSGESTLLDRVAAQLDEYFAGTRTEFDLPLAPRGTQFQLEVWRALETIPYGETMTYGELATSIGRPTAARAVGNANRRNPLSIVVPCHRVIGSTGALTGFAGGLGTKEQLLDMEHQAA